MPELLLVDWAMWITGAVVIAVVVVAGVLALLGLYGFFTGRG